MIVHKFHVAGIAGVPLETDLPLVVDTNTPLSFAITFEHFKPISDVGIPFKTVGRPGTSYLFRTERERKQLEKIWKTSFRLFTEEEQANYFQESNARVHTS